MGSLCGWCGSGLDPELSRQTVDDMLGDSAPPSGTLRVGDYKENRSLAVCEGLYTTGYSELDGVQAALIGSPRWDSEKLSKIQDRNLVSILIQAYRDLGTEFLTRLHGPFALAILDGDTAFIAVDRIGIHALSYTVQNGTFVFSTSTNSVAMHPRAKKNIDPQAVFNYLYFHDIPSPGTIYQDVQKLLPAQYIHYQNGHVEKGFYWRLHYNDGDNTSFQDEKQSFSKLLRSTVVSIPREVPIAAFLSGGLDSSTVTGVLAESMPDPVAAYSIGFDAEGFDEMAYARTAARHFGARLHEYYLKPNDILEAIPVITKTYDEPFGNDSAVPTYFCAKRAAEDGVQSILAGDGGDEIFGGNARYARQMVFEHFTRIPKRLREHVIEPLVFGTPGGDAFLPIRKLRSYIRQAKIPLPARMESYNFLHRLPLDEIFEADFLSSVDSAAPDALLRDAYFRTESTHPINRMLHLDMKFTLADNDLRKVSRMCEAAGIKVHYPLLDESLVEFSAKLPPRYKVRGRKLRWFFKEALKDFLPREIIHKNKHGFGLPFGVWALSHPPLKMLVDETLTRFEDRGYLQPEYIRNLRRLHAEEHPTYYGKMIWVMLMLELWLQEHCADNS